MPKPPSADRAPSPGEPALAAEAVRAALSRISGSDTFEHAPMLRRLLEHVVLHTLADNRDQLKEYALGVDVFRRGASFDPRSDTIVRVQARRLRAKLADYYAGEGRLEAVRIAVPTGSYRAEFRQVLVRDNRASADAMSPHAFGAARACQAGPSMLDVGDRFEGVEVAGAPADAGDSVVCWMFCGKREFPLRDGEHVIGRDANASICLESPNVSRRHARIVVSGARASIEDLGSKNGSFVGDRRVVRPTPLASGDEVRIGPFKLLFRVAAGSASTETQAW